MILRNDSGRARRCRIPAQALAVDWADRGFYNASCMKPKRGLMRTVWSIVLLLASVGVFAAVRRVFHLTPSTEPPRFPGAETLDVGFIRHPRLTLVHIIPGL